MIIECLPIGLLGSNCYIVGHNNEGVIIDPGVETDSVMNLVEERGLKIKYIVLTHGHIDHICYVDELRKRTGAKVIIHESDADKLLNPIQNCSLFILGYGKTFNAADVLVKDGDRFDAGGLDFEVIHTPGHTSGGICIKLQDNIFTGDTLFRMGRGRTDLGDGSEDALMTSIARLLKYDDSVTAYPGHNGKTTIGYEKISNLY